MFYLVLCLLVTVVVEVLCALVFFKVRSVCGCLLVVAVNLITNPLMNFILYFPVKSGYARWLLGNSVHYFFVDYYWFIFVFLEVLIVGIEGFIYWLFNKYGNFKGLFRRPFLFSFILNLVSCVFGCVVWFFLS